VGRARVGTLIRQWRTRRNLSQMELAQQVFVSARHLSFVETGRSRPSPELVLAIAAALDVPLRQRNTLLLAAGYAPRFSELPLDAPSMLPLRRSVQRMLDAHDPYPGVAIDRCWNIVMSNRAAAALVADVSPELSELPFNIYRLCLHPRGLATVTLDFGRWAAYLLDQLRRSIDLTGDERLLAIAAEVYTYPNVAALAADGPRETGTEEQPLLVPWTIQRDGHVLSLFTTLTTFGTPLDVTLEELAIELFFPADDHTDKILHAAA
jgi:transcriptional regulator with XRE-family HTH domain